MAIVLLATALSFASSPEPERPLKMWEYGRLQASYSGSTKELVIVRWTDRKGDIKARTYEELCLKLSDRPDDQSTGELKAWNAIGEKGWEFATSEETGGDIISKISIFKRPRN